MKRNHLSKAILSFVMAMAFASIFARTNDVQTANKSDKTTTSIQYCTSYEDLKSNNWKQADSVQVVTKSRNKQMWWGGTDFKFDSDNKATRQILKKDAFAINYNDTLLVNTRSYKDRGVAFSNGYARAFCLKDGRLLMTYFNVSKMNAKAAIGGMFGVIGALAVSASAAGIAQQDVCYIITPGQKKTLIIDDKLMNELLKDNQSLLDEYNQIEKKENQNAEIVIPLLKKANLL